MHTTSQFFSELSQQTHKNYKITCHNYSNLAQSQMLFHIHVTWLLYQILTKSTDTSLKYHKHTNYMTLCHLPILRTLLYKLCSLTSCPGMLEPSTKVCLAFIFFGMLRQSNLMPSSPLHFDPSLHTFRSDIIVPLPLSPHHSVMAKETSNHWQVTSTAHPQGPRPSCRPCCCLQDPADRITNHKPQPQAPTPPSS